MLVPMDLHPELLPPDHAAWKREQLRRAPRVGAESGKRLARLLKLDQPAAGAAKRRSSRS